jgi:large subunit ribosomal protein L16
MFIPKKSKYKKQQKGRSFKKVIINKSCFLRNTKQELALKALSSARISSKQLIASRQTINKIIKKHGQLNICIFSDTPITKKPTEIRMGKGKGSVDSWVKKVKVGTILFKIKIPILAIGIKAFKLVQKKLPIKTKII